MKGRVAIAGSAEGAMLERIVEILLEQGFTDRQIVAETEGIADRHRVKERMMTMLKGMGPKKPNDHAVTIVSRASDPNDEQDQANAQGAEEEISTQSQTPVE
jgi:hypothetical protein